MIDYIRKIYKSQFIRNVSIMVLGTAGAQAITVLMSPIITRLYGPEAFGIMGTFTSIINIVIPISALTYPVAIVLPKQDSEAISIIRLSIKIAIFISLLSLSFLILFNEQIANIFNLKDVSLFLYLIPIVILTTVFMQVAEQWLIRKKSFGISARVTFYQSLIINSSKTGFGLFYPNTAVLVIHTAISNALRALLMILHIKSSAKKIFIRKVNNNNTESNVARKYKDFPLFRAPETFLNAISQGLPVLMLSAFFGPASAGFYTLGRTTLSIPGTLIGKAVGDVFYPRITQAFHNKENMSKILKKATLMLALIGIVPFGIVIFFGPHLFSFVFGSEWYVAGEYARWIALWTYFGFMNRPSVRSLPVLGAQKFHLFYTILMLIVRIAVLIIGYFVFKSDQIAVALFGISGAILNLGLILATSLICKSFQHKHGISSR